MTTLLRMDGHPAGATYGGCGLQPDARPKPTYRVVPIEGRRFGVLDENGELIHSDMELRHPHEAVNHAETIARERGISVNIVQPLGYSSGSLQVIDEFRRRLGRSIQTAALRIAQESGRGVVTEDDAWQVIEQLEDRIGLDFFERNTDGSA